jgi:hypothetical protein
VGEADDLEVPESSEQLYLARGEDVNRHRPFLQGDVFDGTTIPGVDDQPALAIITTHACSMRPGDGVRLAEHLHLARVEARPGAPGIKGWFSGCYGEMPLPDLMGEGQGHFTARLDLIGRASSAWLGNRVACLFPYGITILQQRIVNRLTRVKISKDVFQEQSAPVFEEADLMEDWIEASAALEVPRNEAERSFHEFIRRDRGAEMSLQTQLEDEGKRAHVRQVVREEIAKLFPAPV